MIFRLIADAVVAIHAAFVVFVVTGALLTLRWPRVAWIHIPAAVWGTLIELAGWICPLTPLENHLRVQSGEHGYQTSFVEHYVIPLLYPGTLTRGMQIGLGLAVVALNVGIYAFVLRRHRKRQVHP